MPKKGIILAGGLGSRLFPLTEVLSKQILPVYDKPMIYYPLSVLMELGIQDILIISSPRDLPGFKNLLKNGSQWGLNFSFVEQPSPDGLAQAFILGEEFIGSDDVTLILGDNIFFGDKLAGHLDNLKNASSGATIVTCEVDQPEHYGVIYEDSDGNPTEIVEKPKNPQSNNAVVGLYAYDNKVVEYAKSLKPSARGELEITDLNNVYLKNKTLRVEKFSTDTFWMDAGQHSSLLEAANAIQSYQNKNNCKVGSPEIIALNQGFITKDEFKKRATEIKQSEYGQYLMSLV